MKKQHHLNKKELIAKAKADALAFMTSGRAVKLIAMIVLREKFQFSADDLRLFLDSFEDVLDYYNKSKGYQDLLHEWDDFFHDELGEYILYREEHGE